MTRRNASPSKPQVHTDHLLQIYGISHKLRALRSAKRLTLSRLAAECGLSTALLSKLETDRMTPTLGTLARLCKVYGIGLGYFFSDPQKYSLAITRRVHLPAREYNGPTESHTALHVPTSEGRMLAETLDIPPGITSTMSRLRTKMEIFAYVLAGSLQINVAGSVEELKAGDCAFLDTDVPVTWRVLGEASCRVLTVKCVN